MDHAVSLVQAYLHANGYFTVAEHPVLERTPGGGYKSATDIDLMGLRLPEAGGVVAAERGASRGSGGDPGSTRTAGSGPGPGSDPDGGPRFEPDPALAIPSDCPDLIIAEVKEGQAVLNRGGFGPEVLEAVLLRFGASRRDEVGGVVDTLRETGEARLGSGTSVRIFAFGSVVDPRDVRGFRAVSLVQVTAFLESYLGENWDILRHAQIRHSALGFLALEEQIRRAREAARREDSG